MNARVLLDDESIPMPYHGFCERWPCDDGVPNVPLHGGSGEQTCRSLENRPVTLCPIVSVVHLVALLVRPWPDLGLPRAAVGYGFTLNLVYDDEREKACLELRRP